MEDVAKTGALNSGGFTLDEVVVQFNGILSMRQDAIYWLRVSVRCDSTATTGAGRPDGGATHGDGVCADYHAWQMSSKEDAKPAKIRLGGAVFGLASSAARLAHERPGQGRR
jgi:hypothetical protein